MELPFNDKDVLDAISRNGYNHQIIDVLDKHFILIQNIHDEIICDNWKF